MTEAQLIAVFRRMIGVLQSPTNRAIINNIIGQLQDGVGDDPIALAIYEARAELRGSDADREDEGIAEALRILNEAVGSSNRSENGQMSKRQRDALIDIETEISDLKKRKEKIKQLALNHRSQLVGDELNSYNAELDLRIEEIDEQIENKIKEKEKFESEKREIKKDMENPMAAKSTRTPTIEERQASAYAAGIAFAKIEIAKRTKGKTQHKLTDSEAREILRYNTPETIETYSGGTIDLRAAAKYPFETIGTTSEVFIPATESVLGQNNLGIFIPTTVLYDLLQIRSRQGAFFGAVRKLSVAEKIDFPYMEGSTGAEWVDELDCTPDQAQKYKKLELGFCNLAKYVKITWSIAKMTPENLLRFILTEIRNAMDRALNIAVLYGQGKNATVTEKDGAATRNTPQPYGVMYQTTNPDKVGVSAKKFVFNPSLTQAQVDAGEGFRNIYDFMVMAPIVSKNQNPTALDGARYYLSFAAYHQLFNYKMEDGTRLYRPTDRIENWHLFGVEMDWDLQGLDAIFGNPQNYILNEIEPIRIYNDSNIKCRYDEYAAFGMYDGKGIPDSFVAVSDSTEPRSSVPLATKEFRKKINYRGQNPVI